MRIDWTPEATEHVRRLYIEEGRSSRQVAALLGAPFTYNAIVGKAHRMGWFIDASRQCKPTALEERALRLRVATATARIKPPKPAARAVTKPPAPPKPEEPPKPEPMPFHRALGAQCSWPVGPADEEPTSEMLVCAAPVDGGHPYCAAHLRLSRSGRRLQPLKLGMFGLAEVGHERRRVA
jgi:hypothetical protein